MGKLIVIDGLDGSGKETQSLILKKRLEEAGVKVRYISFPQYDSDSSLFVKKYLNGELGFADIAKIVNQSLPSVYRTYRRALKNLREYLNGGYE